MKQLEGQVRVAIRDAVNRPSRKPFYWGGLAGYQQLQAIAHGLRSVPRGEKETAYLQQLAHQVERVLVRNRVLAHDLREAHDWLRRVAACLRYPPNSYQDLLPYVLELLSTQGDYVLLGWSFSGPLALMAACTRPSGLRAVVLCAPSAPGSLGP